MNASHYDHQKLKEHRKKKFTQDELANLINYDVKSISRAENGISASFELLSAIATQCEFSIKEIIFDNVQHTGHNQTFYVDN